MKRKIPKKKISCEVVEQRYRAVNRDRETYRKTVSKGQSVVEENEGREDKLEEIFSLR
jgi:hypothetical protein